MKIDFYDLFSLHTPGEFPEEGTDNYITAAVKSRVAEQISPKKRKPVRVGRIGRIFLSAAAAAVILVTGALAASALGFIDLERIFGGMFKSGSENLAGITAVPQNVTVTGDDRLSFRVLGVGGTANEAFAAIEIKRNDGGTFPECIGSNGFGEIEGTNAELVVTNKLVYVDETTAVYYFRDNAVDIGDTTDTIVGNTFTYKLSEITDVTELEKMQQKYDVYIDDGEDAAYYQYLLENKDVVIKGDWTVTFPLDYTVEERSISVNEPYSENSIISSVITEVKLSAISLNVYLDEFYGEYGDISRYPYNAVIKLDSGEEYTVQLFTACVLDGGKSSVGCYSFDKPIDIDSVETVTVGNVIIDVK